MDQPCFRSARTRLSSASACVRAAEAAFLLGLGLIELETHMVGGRADERRRQSVLPVPAHRRPARVRDRRSSPLHGASRLPEVLTDLRLDVRARSPDIVKHVIIKFEK